MDDLQLTAVSFMFTMVGFETVLILLIWFGSHKPTLKRLADGEPVIHQPAKQEKTFIWRVEAAPCPMVIYPHKGPLRNIGATASVGMLKRWSVYMAVLSAVVILSKYFFGYQWWFGGLGYLCLLMVFLYLGDIPLVEDNMEKLITTFAWAHFPVGSALLLSFSRLMGWIPLSDAVFYTLVAASLLLFLYLTKLPVPSDDIVYQIKKWKKNRKHKWWPPGR